MKINDTNNRPQGLSYSEFKVGAVARLVECAASDPQNIEATPPGDLYLFGTSRADDTSPDCAINLRTGFVLKGLVRVSRFTPVDAEVIVK